MFSHLIGMPLYPTATIYIVANGNEIDIVKVPFAEDEEFQGVFAGLVVASDLTKERVIKNYRFEMKRAGKEIAVIPKRQVLYSAYKQKVYEQEMKTYLIAGLEVNMLGIEKCKLFAVPPVLESGFIHKYGHCILSSDSNFIAGLPIPVVVYKGH